MTAERMLRRRARLEAAGASDDVARELLAYGEPLFPDGWAPRDPETVPEEPQVAAWEEYAREARRVGAFAILSRTFRRLPPDLRLRDPSGVSLSVGSTLAGRVPTLIANDRGDFETLVRALSSRGEVPPSMGGCLVRGLPDRDGVEYRFVILSRGPYSGVAAEAARVPPEDWLPLSLALRREHEATHYLMLRAAGAMRANLLDELIADWAALQRTIGRYDARLALLFFGLEDYPSYRDGGRLQNYRGGLSPDAYRLVQRLVFDAVRALEKDEAGLAPVERGGCGGSRVARTVLSLASCALDELAAGVSATSGREACGARPG